MKLKLFLGGFVSFSLSKNENGLTVLKYTYRFLMGMKV